MVVVVRMFKHVTPQIVEVFEKHDEQTCDDAVKLAEILSRKNGCEYKVFVDYDCLG